MEKEIKILVCAHREAALPPHKYFYPIQVGAALTNTRFYHAQDNTGDNISDKNPHFCELTAHYWACMGHRTKRFFQWSGKMGERF